MKPEDYGIKNYKFNPDGTLDVFQNVYMDSKHLKELPFKFGKVDGYFSCSNNKLISLKGAPRIVNGDFYCDDNNLKSFKGIPEIVNGDVNCTNNNLKSLDGLNFDGIYGKIFIFGNPNLKLTEKEEFWIILNPGKLKSNWRVRQI